MYANARDMSNYKFYYFDARARGETSRMLFKLGGRKFEDVRIQQSDWPTFKAKTPLGFLPYLEFDGKILSQSNAINRFLAKKFNLAGRGVFEEAVADMVVDTVTDATVKGKVLYLGALQGEALEAARTAFREDVQGVFMKVQGLLEQNGGGDGFFVGNALTWADVQVFNTIEFCSAVLGHEDMVKDLPKLAAFKERIAAIPQIADFIKNRPDRPF